MAQRQIKFRAWDNYAKEWLMGYQYESLGGFSLFGEVMLLEEWSAILDRFVLQCTDRTPADLIVMQFTGLFDKNGKEIYEGDIVLLTSLEITPVTDDGNGPLEEVKTLSRVEFENGCFGVYVLEDSSEFGAGFSAFADISKDIGLDDLEVVGNIYENPELLN